MHLRRAGLRLAFHTGGALGLTVGDPARDLVLPQRSSLPFRPVTDDEAAMLRDFSVFSVRPTRHAACVALALAGVHTGEIGHLTIDDVDLARRTVRAHGSLKAHERVLPLDAWATATLTARLGLLRARPEATSLLAASPDGTDAQRQARVCVALGDVMRRAGLGAEVDLRPSSLTAHAGAATFARRQRIEDAAHVLGLRSLDRTATTIGHHWLDEAI